MEKAIKQALEMLKENGFTLKAMQVKEKKDDMVLVITAEIDVEEEWEEN